MSRSSSSSSSPPPPGSPSMGASAYRMSLQGRLAFSAFLTIFFAIVLFVCCRAARNSRRHHPILAIITPRAYVDGGDLVHSSPGTGLSAKALRALPVQVYSASAVPAGGSPVCPVCLEEFRKGEKWKLIPSCGHGFHVGCIDMWLCSHTTCPVCRAVVKSEVSGQSAVIV